MRKNNVPKALIVSSGVTSLYIYIWWKRMEKRGCTDKDGRLSDTERTLSPIGTDSVDSSTF